MLSEAGTDLWSLSSMLSLVGAPTSQLPSSSLHALGLSPWGPGRASPFRWAPGGSQDLSTFLCRAPSGFSTWQCSHGRRRNRRGRFWPAWEAGWRSSFHTAGGTGALAPLWGASLAACGQPRWWPELGTSGVGLCLCQGCA